MPDTVIFQSDRPATPPIGTPVAVDGAFQIVKLDVGGTGASLPLSTTNPMPVKLAALVTEPFNAIIVNYTDATKTVITTVIYKMDADIVATVTCTSTTTSDTFTRS